MKVQVRGPLPIGTTLLLDEQSYRLVRMRDYQRQDGGVAKIAIWLSNCPRCQQPFEAETSGLSRLPNRRCTECRQAAGGVPIKGNRKAVEAVIDLTGIELSKE